MKIRDGFVSNSSSSSFIIKNKGKKFTLSEMVKAYCERLTAAAAENDIIFKHGTTEFELSSEVEDAILFDFFFNMPSCGYWENIELSNLGRKR